MSHDAADQEFVRLVDENRRAVQRYVLRRFSDPEGSEDVVIETFAVAWRKRNELPPRERESPWLYGIAFRVISNHRRSRDQRERRRHSVDASEEVPSSTAREHGSYEG